MILLLGKNGYVSSRFQDFFKYKKVDYAVESLREYTSQSYVSSLLKKHNPSFVINCIGYTGNPNVDSCEDNKEKCLYANVTLAEIIADSCKERNVPLGFVSSGCIYNDYTETNEYIFSEKDFPNFSFPTRTCSWYSGTKALGENIVRKSWEKSYIWRLRMPFNHLPGNKNYISKLFDYSKVWSCDNSLTNIDEFVQICYYSLIKEISYGTYNLVNPNGISAKDILEIAKEYNLKKEKYEYFSNLEEFSRVIKAPRSNCILDSSKISEQGLSFLPVENSLHKTFQFWNKKEENPFW